MFATPLRNLLLATVLIAGSLIALGNGRIDSVVTSALSDPVMSAKLDAVVPNREIDDPDYVNTTVFGLWHIDPD
jgi:hypothetical protein